MNQSAPGLGCVRIQRPAKKLSPPPMSMICIEYAILRSARFSGK